MIRFDKLTLKGQEALQSRAVHAQEKGNPQVAPEHLLSALIEQKEGVVLPILQKLGVNLQTRWRGICRPRSKSCRRFQGRPNSTSAPGLIAVLEDASKKPINSRTNTSVPSTC